MAIFALILFMIGFVAIIAFKGKDGLNETESHYEDWKKIMGDKYK